MEDTKEEKPNSIPFIKHKLHEELTQDM